jgi:multicomponent Na+:H+ antiporter subunit D
MPPISCPSYRAWLKPAPAAWPKEHILARPGRETNLLLLLPTLATAVITLAVGFMTNVSLSPLNWARLIAAQEYPQ